MPVQCWAGVNVAEVGSTRSKIHTRVKKQSWATCSLNQELPTMASNGTETGVCVGCATSLVTSSAWECRIRLIRGKLQSTSMSLGEALCSAYSQQRSTSHENKTQKSLSFL